MNNRIKKSINIFIIIYCLFVYFYYAIDFINLGSIPISSRLFYSSFNERSMLKAVVKGDLEAIENLVTKGEVDVNNIDITRSLTFLQFAYLSEKKNSFVKLLELGAHPDNRVSKRHMFTISTYESDSYYFDTMLKYKNNFINFKKAISGHYFYSNNTDRLESLRRYKLLYSLGADPNLPRPNELVLPLESALHSCDYDRVLVLLKYRVKWTDIATDWLIKPPIIDEFINRESKATRENIKEYLENHYNLNIVLENVIDTGEIIN